MGVPVIGSVGVLIAAKVRGDIAALAPLLVALRTSGLWLADRVVAAALASVGEEPR